MELAVSQRREKLADLVREGVLAPEHPTHRFWGSGIDLDSYPTQPMPDGRHIVTVTQAGLTLIGPRRDTETIISPDMQTRSYTTPFPLADGRILCASTLKTPDREEVDLGLYVFDPAEIRKQDRTPYRVFTPYYRKGCLENGPDPREPLPAPSPELLGEFSQLYPGIELSLKVTNRDRVMERLGMNQDDIFILGQMDEFNNEVEVVPFAPNPLVVVAPKDHPLVGKKNITIEEL